MTEVDYSFVTAGSVVDSEPGKVYVDVGNYFGPGILDHHHADAPDACASLLALKYPDFILSQIKPNQPVTILTHLFPDIDAIGASWFVKRQLNHEEFSESDNIIADYICAIDRGYTTLHPNRPLTAYAVMMMHLDRIYSSTQEPNKKSLQALLSGFKLLETFSNHITSDKDLNSSEWVSKLPGIQQEINAISGDLLLYKKDIANAKIFECQLPKKDGVGIEQVKGLRVSQPESRLFKSWARGDAENSKSNGFIFTVIQLNHSRTIISVSPDSNVYLKGLGDHLQQAETAERKLRGLSITGQNRPGYDSPDPWYDGRSPLHNYTIIDSPKSGTILDQGQIHQLINQYCQSIAST